MSDKSSQNTEKMLKLPLHELLHGLTIAIQKLQLCLHWLE